MILLSNAMSFGEPWQWAVAAWVFVVGACVGSFLNVVIYRLPAGMSIVHPPSHCPACHRPIRCYDNVPIASWVILRGRCRDCGATFSSRYAWIELASGAMLFALAATGPLCRYPSLGAMLDDAGAIAAWSQVAHLAALLACIWAAAMIARDGHRPPGRLFLTPAVIGLGVAILWPQLYAMPELATLGIPDLRIGPATTWTGACGAAVGAIAFDIAVRLSRGLPPRKVGPAKQRNDRAALLGATSGLFLGWQLTVIATVVACWLRLIQVSVTILFSKPPAAPNRSWPACFALAASIVLLAFRTWAAQAHAIRSPPWPDGWPWWPLGACLAIVVPAWLARRATRRAVRQT